MFLCMVDVKMCQKSHHKILNFNQPILDFVCLLGGGHPILRGMEEIGIYPVVTLLEHVDLHIRVTLSYLLLYF